MVDREPARKKAEQEAQEKTAGFTNSSYDPNQFRSNGTNTANSFLDVKFQPVTR
ncbi:MAG: hypothetical protein R3C11_25475 [Planctomycetaceae bacterium]